MGRVGKWGLFVKAGSSPGDGGRLGFGSVVVLVEAGDDAKVGTALRAVVLSLTAQDAAALVHCVPAEIATERRARAHCGSVARSRLRLCWCALCNNALKGTSRSGYGRGGSRSGGRGRLPIDHRNCSDKQRPHCLLCAWPSNQLRQKVS